MEENRLKDILALSFNLNKEYIKLENNVKCFPNETIYKLTYIVDKTVLGLSCKIKIGYFEISIKNDLISIKKC